MRIVNGTNILIDVINSNNPIKCDHSVVKIAFTK